MNRMIRPVFSVAAAAMVVVVASCGSVEREPEPTGGAYPAPETPVPEGWGPVPLSAVWDAAPGVDLDSPPVQIARAFLDGLVYRDAGVGLEEGYEGLTEFSGIAPNTSISEHKPPITGTYHYYIQDVSIVPRGEYAEYSVTVCKSGAGVAEWTASYRQWWNNGLGLFRVNFSLPGDPIDSRNTEPAGGESINMVERVQHPSWNVFEDATYLNERGSPGLIAWDDETHSLREECLTRVPADTGTRVVDGPVEPAPWFPGWPGRSV